jgi:hypothetical protein
LDGEEASFMVVAHGLTALPLATSQDHKRLLDADLGPNTGGMGAYSPAPVVTPEIHAKVMREVIQPTLKGMQQDGIPYSGFLYAGLMIGREGKLKVLGVTSRLPSASLPGVLPLAAQGFEGFEAISWHAMLAPAGTDPAILLRLQQMLTEILATAPIKEKFSAQYFSAVGSSAQVLQALMQTEKKRWDEVMARLNLSLD